MIFPQCAKLLFPTVCKASFSHSMQSFFFPQCAKLLSSWTKKVVPVRYRRFRPRNDDRSSYQLKIVISRIYLWKKHLPFPAIYVLSRMIDSKKRASCNPEKLVRKQRLHSHAISFHRKKKQRHSHDTTQKSGTQCMHKRWHLNIIPRRLEHKQTNWFLNRTFV